MYERSAIVLERYLDKLFGFDKENNLRDNFSNFKDLIEELKEYYDNNKSEKSFSICPFYKIINEYRVIVLNNKVELIYKKELPSLVVPFWSNNYFFFLS